MIRAPRGSAPAGEDVAVMRRVRQVGHIGRGQSSELDADPAQLAHNGLTGLRR